MHRLSVNLVVQTATGPAKDQHSNKKRQLLVPLLHIELDLWVNTDHMFNHMFKFLFPVTPDYEGIVNISQPTLWSQQRRWNGYLLELLHVKVGHHGAQWTSLRCTVSLFIKATILLEVCVVNTCRKTEVMSAGSIHCLLFSDETQDLLDCHHCEQQDSIKADKNIILNIYTVWFYTVVVWLWLKNP